MISMKKIHFKTNLGNDCRCYSGRSARKRRSGDRPGTISLRTCAALSSSFCHFTSAMAGQNLEGIAKTVRPREKGFISAISRFQNAAQKKNMNDVRGQKMSEKTISSF